MSGAGIYIKTPSGLVAAATVPGKQGSQGPQSSLVPGTTTTGAAGTNVIVGITGAGPVQSLNLTIPKGDPGGWVAATAVATGTDLNTMTTPGTYVFSANGGNTTALNHPVHQWAGHLHVSGNPTLFLAQIAYPFDNNNGPTSRAFFRTRTSATTWTTWRELEFRGTAAEVLAAPDLNTLTTPGTYYINGSHTNSAIAGGSIIEVAAQAFNTLTQMQSVVGTGRTFRRTCSGGAWTAWSELMTKVDAATPTTLMGVLAGNGSVVAATPSIPVLRNLLPNSSFTGGTTAGWTGNQATLAVSGGILTATAFGAASGTTTAVSGELVQGRIYYVSARARVQSACQYISTYDGVALVTMQGSPAADAWLDVSAQFTARANYSSVNFYQGFVDAPTAAGKTLDIDYAVAIDLTTVFGAGKEPSKAEMDAIMADLNNWFADTDFKVVPTHSKRFRESAVANLVRNTYFHTGTAGWLATGATLTTSGVTATLTATGVTIFPFAAYDTSELRLGQKGYLRAQVRAASGSTPTNLQIQYGGTPVTLASPVVGTWYTISGVVTASSSGAASSMVVLAQYADAAAANGAVVEFRYPLSINLTATFGAGNEPTASEMDLLLSKYPNSNFLGTVNDLFSPIKEYVWRRRGTGSPEGVVTANPGTEWTDTAGTNGAWKWIKKTGTGNTGWQVVEGDTGWRNLASTKDASLTAGSFIHIRRIGDRVSWAGEIGRTLFTPNVPEPICPIPAGFRNSMPSISSSSDWTVLDSNGGSRSFFVWARSTTLQSYVRNGASLSSGACGLAAVAYPTTEAWPTTLPGTAA